MKKKNIILLFQLLFLSNLAFSQDFWELLPFPDSLKISCLAINQQGDIFVGTNTQLVDDGVFRSQDAGQSWELVLEMGASGPASIAINKSGEIFILGGMPGWYLTKSSDNGQSWESLSIPDFGFPVKIVAQGTDTLFVSQWASNGAMLLKSENGGIDWEVAFTTENHTSEYIHDIAIAPNGDIYISLMCFAPDMGGVYKSTDGGATWEFLGLFNHQVKEVEVNEQGDLFIGVYGNFLGIGVAIYAIYHDNPQMEECFYGASVNGLAINSAGHIYAGINWPEGVIVSKDNGISFDLENTGLLPGPKGKLYCDTQDYIYALTDVPSHHIYRTTSPTVGIQEIGKAENRHEILIAPNPVRDKLRGKFNVDFPDGSYAYTISNLNGSKISAGSVLLSQQSFFIDISVIPAGYYLLQINHNGLAYPAKIIKL